MDYLYYNSWDIEKMGLTREDYQSYCEDNEMEYDETDEEAYSEWVREELDMEWEDVEWEIKHYDKEHCSHYYIEADLGLWYGRRDGYKVCDSLWKAVCACINDMDYIILEMNDNGTLNIEGIHHDGRNSFTIKKMTDEADNRYNDWKYEYHSGEEFELNDDDVESLIA